MDERNRKMSEHNIILCKIGKRMCTESLLRKNDDEFIEVHDKLWSIYKVYNNYIQEITTIYEQLSVRKILDYIEINDELNMIYKNPKRIKNEEKDLLEKLFTLIFINYPIQWKKTMKEGTEMNVEIDVFSSHNETQKTYITTKLFEALRDRHNAISTKQQLQQRNHRKVLNLPRRFLPKLCKYQQETLLWLLQREGEQLEQFSNFYIKLMAHDMETYIYKHLYKWELSNIQSSDIILAPGGILAEEMGLGKTVEILALILLHPRRYQSVYPNKWQQQLLQQDHPYAKRKHFNNVQLLCICKATTGDAITENCDIIECNKCHLWQHRQCVLNNEENTENIENVENYYCPQCWKILTNEFGYLQIKATFIVSPNIIKIQWLEEIQRHIQPTLKVLLYPGVGNNKWISPIQLSTYDIVLTDYTILRQEIYYTPTNVSDRCTRTKVRPMRVPCPLLMVQWWRVCLDEAQMVENGKNTNAMVRMLPAINRWAVTGTPIQRSLDDLKNLLEFIGFDEITDSLTWNYLVNDFIINYEHNLMKNNDNNDDDDDESNISISMPLINMLQKCMRRTSKNDVINELKVPSQLEIVHRIDFSNLEKLFYNEQHNECVETFQNNVMKYQCRGVTVSPQIMKIILQPFLKIRQSCTRPVIVIGGTNYSKAEGSGGTGGSCHEKYFQKPEELHKYLKGQNELCCKTELRSIASAHNGLAGLYFLKNQYDEAMKHYETVLKLAKDYTDLNVSVDSLLQIHALHNIMQILIISHNDGDDNKSQILHELLEPYELAYNKLEWKYLCTYANTLTNVNEAYQQILQNYRRDICKEYLPFLSEYLTQLNAKDEIHLIQKIRDDYQLRMGNSGVLKLNELHSSPTIIYIMKLWFIKVTDLCHHIMDEFVKLKYFSDNIKARNQVTPSIWRQMMHLIQEVVNCHLNEIHVTNETNKHQIAFTKQNKSAKKKLCKMCYIRSAINNFECLLYDKSLDENTNCTKGFDNPSFEMLLHKLIFTYLKTKYPHPDIQHQIDSINQYFDNLTQLYKRVSKLWIEMEYTIKAYDELNMCKMRLQIIDDDNEANKTDGRKKSHFHISKHDVDELMQQQQHTILTAQHTFIRKLARLKYIRYLESNATDNLAKCPICYGTDHEWYAVLECGHCLCYLCFKNIRTSLKDVYFKCSICRNQQRFQNVYFASRSTDNTSNNNTIIKGHYSSKIAYIIRLILKLQQQQQQQEQQDGEKEKESEEIDRVKEREKTEIEANNQPVKILIFSQWQSILESIASALNDNCINYRIKCTPKTIKEFKDPQLKITCLLMPFIKGSKGLNLIEATHVFLVEPILNPAEELQAIGRVHRFGQIRTTTVHRFIVNGTVEENIFNFLAAKKHENNVETIKAESAASTQTNWEFKNVSLEDFEKMFTLKCDNDISNYN